MSCNCYSYNGEIGTTPEVELDPREYFDFCTKTVCVDACIAEQIETLWKNGIWTGGCCCGHNGYFGEQNPSVVIYEGFDAEKAKEILSENDTERMWKVLQWKLTKI